MKRTVALLVLALGPPFAVAAEPVQFASDVRPIFERHCYGCHGPDKQKSGLRLDMKAAAFKGGDAYGPAIVPSSPDKSPLLQLARGDEPELRMPPKGPALSQAELATLQRWIQEGAHWPEGVDRVKLMDPTQHWSFQPLVHPELLPAKDDRWPQSDIDRFILARLGDVGLQPASEAARVDWLRRVCFDLTGLPPTPELAQPFLRDPSQHAYLRVVDELLDSPRYGERAAQHWLDVVRYADTHGFEVNTERPHAWPYRDYVIRAFNADTPYDQFVREQIVGDTLGQDAATGFLVTASVLLPAQIGKDEPSKRLARHDALDDILVNVSQTLLGLSVGCARCHDHKFDPISHAEYYSLLAFFSGIEYRDRQLQTPEAEALRIRQKQFRGELLTVKQQLAGLVPPADSGAKRPAAEAASKPIPESALKDLSPTDQAEVRRLESERKRLEASIQSLESGQKAFAGVFREPDRIQRLLRGDPEQPKEEVTPAVPSILGQVKLAGDASEVQRRQVLADWLTNPQNPLTARVYVNRIWQGHFGTGLVETASDFGLNGSRPSHPELLDWLAAEFIRSGRSTKHLHRLIVLSATYRQSSQATGAGAELDHDVRLLWRYPAGRLSAEAIRDAMLAVSGQLHLKMYGPGFNLFDRRGGLTGFTPIETYSGDGLRRMIYAHKVRRERDAVFGAFDCPDGGQSTSRRRESTTAIQALNLLNSRFTIDQAAAFAERVQADAGDEIAAQVCRAYELAFCRQPNAEELSDAREVVKAHGLSTLCRAIFNSNEFLFVP